MFLEKYKNRYSFNFLAVCGWIVFVLFSMCFSPLIFVRGAGISPVIAWMFGIIFLLDILFCILTFVIYVFEIIFNLRISNQKFLQSRKIYILQILGIGFSVFPIMFMVLSFVFDYITELFSSLIGLNNF